MQDYEDLYKSRCKELKENGLALDELNKYENFKDILSEDDFKNCIRKKQNRKNKRYRTKEMYLTALRLYLVYKLQGLNPKIIFGTYNPSKETLSLKEDTYMRKINGHANKHNDYVIMNKDFSPNEREHYHFLGITTEELVPVISSKTGKHAKSKKGHLLYNYKDDVVEFGFLPTLEIIDCESQDISKIINYLLKLNNHSNKDSTKSRVRVLKSHRAEMMILIHNLEPKKALNKAKKSFYEKIKYTCQNPSYDTLNKKSVSSDKDIVEISVERFVHFLDNNNYNEL